MWQLIRSFWGWPMPHEHATLNWPLKIALFTHSVNPRGGVVHTIELATALHQAGHQVTIFVPAVAGQRLFRPVPCRVQLVNLVGPSGQSGPSQGLVAHVAARIAAFEAHLKKVLLREHFDVYHAQDPIGANALANLQAQGLIDGFVRTVHHLDHFESATLMAWQERGMREAMQVFCVSQVWVDTLRTQYGVDAELVHNGVDLKRYQPRTLAGSRSRFGFRGGPEAPVFLALGGIEERKNSIRILQAFALFRQHHARAQLVMAGGASLLDHHHYQHAFRAEAERLGLALTEQAASADPDLVLTGPIADADMPELFQSADALLLPSLREGFGLVVLEALACGTPVVVSDQAPFTEYLRRDEATWADPHDVSSIAKAMNDVLQPTPSSTMRRPVPEVCRRFSWSASALRHVALYRAVMAQRIPTPSL